MKSSKTQQHHTAASLYSQHCLLPRRCLLPIARRKVTLDPQCPVLPQLPVLLFLDRKRKQQTQKTQCWCLACIQLLCYMEKVGLQPSHHKTNTYMNPHTTLTMLEYYGHSGLIKRYRHTCDNIASRFSPILGSISSQPFLNLKNTCSCL